MERTSRLRHAAAPPQTAWLGSDFLSFFMRLHDQFGSRARALRSRRRESVEDALDRSRPPRSLPPSEASGDWQVPPLPGVLCRPGIEISGPVSITPMAVNALNPGPGGARPVGYRDDDEDSAGHCLSATLQAVRNRCAALDGTDLDFRSLGSFTREELREQAHGAAL